MKVRCKTCGIYQNKEIAIRIGLSSFCSKDCYNQAFNTQNKKPKRRTAKSIDPNLRQRVFDADGRRCRLCGEREDRAVLHAHHVVYRSEGGPDELENLLTLCVLCHDIVHSNKRFYQPLAKRIIALREVDNFILIPILAAREMQHNAGDSE
jgi:5-methylcytosine-specific restriction endonuclease McrA